MLKRTVALGTAAAVALLSITALSSCKKDGGTPETTGSAVTEAETGGANTAGITDPLTGMSGYDEKYVGRKPVAIVVENSPDARPQWGMSTPDILAEYEVEGGITRMLWLYSNIDRVPDKVGPVRSARHYAVELALGLDALFVHCGGSDFAYSTINSHVNNGTMSEIDGMKSQPFFERDQTRNVASEHRLVLRGNGLRDWVTSKSVNMTLNDAYKAPFAFNASTVAPNGKDCTDAKISFSASYNYEFKYDASTGKYNCFLNSNARKDDSGTQCAYNNVIVMYVDMESMGTAAGHQNVKFENGGTGLYISAGKCEEIKWTKTSDTDMIRLTGADGSALTLNPGNSYLGLVRSTQQSATSIG